MATDERLNFLIEKAAEAVGSQTRLAEILQIPKSHISQMKAGTRAANWRMRGTLRVIAGQDPTRAYMEAMADELEQSEKNDEKRAADGFRTYLAMPDADLRAMVGIQNEEKPLNANTQGFDSWRKRRDSNPR